MNQIDIEQQLTKKSDAIKAAEKAYVIGCRMTHILYKKLPVLFLIFSLRNRQERMQ